ncbi:MAG: phosphoribosylamine--glycine ligase [Acidobacteria bacterium]|jgi:phosphoribosylamine--glycine ligase|nr:MAG: phosphoribosylamine--glycine ligase [Acidobacteriota bacterium]GIU83175.1 MAG: phosphoribosylamine--glycine ligase [Pyrinomonadaceae bacterium]
MKVLVVGSGGREHAICMAFKKSSCTVYCAEGNAGIAEIAECIRISPTDVNGLAEFAEKEKIELTFVGGETPLALGIVDEFERRGLKIIGANKLAARLEASKAFAKDFMSRHSIPTAKYKVADSIEEAKQILESGFFGGANSPVVIKADGLAGGKGVIVAEDRHQAFEAVENLENVAGKDASQKIVLEERLFGKELSQLVFTDGENFVLMPPVRDHKRIFEGDKGPNTGGMGTVADWGLVTDSQMGQIVWDIVEPTLRGCLSDGFKFKGILFLGLMLEETGGVKVLEYNARLGDPEAQAILPLLETNIIEICDAILNGTLEKTEVKWQNKSAACVVLASQGYPQKPKTGDVIKGLEDAAAMEDIFIFHAGTAKNGEGEFITAGGRVLGVTAVGESLEKALSRAYEAVGKIHFDGMQYRRDIGK